MTRINDFNEVLNSRKSVKVFDENYKIPREEMDEIITNEKAEQIYGDAVEQQLMTEDIKAQLLDWILPYYKNLSREGMKDIVNIDSSLMAMQLMLTAKAHGYDTNPIGGFDKENIADIIGYDSDRYVPVLAIAIGKKAQDAHDSVRLPIDDVREFL